MQTKVLDLQISSAVTAQHCLQHITHLPPRAKAPNCTERTQASLTVLHQAELHCRSSTIALLYTPTNFRQRTSEFVRFLARRSVPCFLQLRNLIEDLTSLANAQFKPTANWQPAGSSFRWCDTHFWVGSLYRDFGCCTHPRCCLRSAAPTKGIGSVTKIESLHHCRWRTHTTPRECQISQAQETDMLAQCRQKCLNCKQSRSSFP